MTDSYVQIAPNSSGAKVDVSEVTRSDGTAVERQRVALADPTLMAALARVSPNGSLQTFAHDHRLDLILVELKVISTILAHGSALDAESLRTGFLIESGS